MTRRDLLARAVALPFARYIPLPNFDTRRSTKFAVISDLHHGLAPDALARLQAFVDAVKGREGLEAIVQMGDFCYSQPESKECTDLFGTLPQAKIHVLGNHDLDKCDKAAAMKFWGMKSRYGSRLIGGYRFVVLDLNHYKKEGTLHAYDNGNYFTDNATHNWADPEQLEWLGDELGTSNEPVILLSHQPLGFADPGKPFPPEQAEVMEVVKGAKQKNPKGSVALSLFGHLHVDRLEHCNEVPCLCVNSASYFWFEGMRPYTKPLFAFMEITADGVLKVEGVAGDFVAPPPSASRSVIGCSGSISSRTVPLH